MREECELWRPVPGFELSYEVSSFGRIKSIDRFSVGVVSQKLKGKVLKLSVSNSGYYFCTLRKDNTPYGLFIHRLVALAFIENPGSKTQVNHIDGDKLNNHVLNLEWNTPRENQKHAELIGLKNYSYNSGGNNVFAKVNSDNAAVMRELRASGMSYRAIAKEVCVSASTVEHFLKGLRYKGCYGNN
jgi:hypothetical protein